MLLKEAGQDDVVEAIAFFAQVRKEMMFEGMVRITL
jgi:hypothetical protein